MIDNAGVSSFYLGKKGLAHVTDIITEEEDWDDPLYRYTT
jgi:hypothetical protein